MASHPSRGPITGSDADVYAHHQSFKYERYEPVVQGPSCPEQALYGGAMGATVGAAFGTLFGGYTAFTNRMGGRDFISFVGKAAAGSAGTFGVFMAVGAFVRCEAERLTNAAAWSDAKAAFDDSAATIAALRTPDAAALF